jgi:hypothetical protein
MPNAYEAERESNAESLTELVIRTRVPSKWRFLDLETGDIWQANPSGDTMFVRADDIEVKQHA